ncbi:hypothetical protein JOC85_003153 [Bacillus mesophilus]|uniref:Phenylalanyl-tRNA synthetase subunit beta n=1 Tax=Bacillus mesophilus TaxID=1808955 RepID=A0A6M0Q9K1_9BACI|nr:hypothetical protein [Bacillus mesophilus]MBM7662346.1 hypothetical protein [Bacillus mesophilus]NEY73024.1 hypothetical protein [Bacillus mesophilus]
MKFWLKVFLSIFIFSGIGWAIYYTATNLASEQLVEAVSTELEISGEMDKVKQEIEQDPDLQAFIADQHNVDEKKLPFKTKEEATRAIIKKVGMTELKQIQEQVQSGNMTKEEVITLLEENLSEEEILALKVIAYKELQK